MKLATGSKITMCVNREPKPVLEGTITSLEVVPLSSCLTAKATAPTIRNGFCSTSCQGLHQAHQNGAKRYHNTGKPGIKTIFY